MELQEFKKLVDWHVLSIENYGDDAAHLLGHVGIALDGNETLTDLAGKLKARAALAFSSGGQGIWERCRWLIEELIQRHVIEDEAIDPYMPIMESVKNVGCPQSPAVRDIVGDWNLAIGCAVVGIKIWKLQGFEADRETHLRAWTRSLEVARSVKRLMAVGYSFHRVRGQIHFAPQSERRILSEMDRRAHSFGGIAMAKKIFSAISNNYDQLQERYHVGRVLSPYGDGMPQYPLGYLLQLAAKHPVGKKPLKNSQDDWQSLLNLTRDYAAVLDVQPYAQPFVLNHDAETLFPKLRENAIYDLMFTLHQMRGSDAVSIARGLLAGLDFSHSYASGWCIDDVLMVSGAILEMSRNERGPLWIDAADLARRCPNLTTAKIGLVLRDVLSHSERGANKKLMNPVETFGAEGARDPGADFYRRPLLRCAGGFLLLDRAMCAPAFVEALFDPLRRQVPEFDSLHLGPRVEVFLRERFEARGIRTRAGKYSVDGNAGECDLVVETKDVVFFIEAKSKSLTSMARAGSEIFMILDLAHSVLRAQTQAGGHELRLRKAKILRLRDQDGSRHELRLDKRSVERIAVTLPDYGSFQDRTILMNFLAAHVHAEYAINLDRHRKQFEEMTEMMRKFRAVETQLDKLRIDARAPYHNCWFLSVPQLLILLDEAHDAESFERALFVTRSITFGTLDFYFEHARMKLSVGAAS